LQSKITDKTKVILLNTPHNPTGKNFQIDELNEIARIAMEHDLLVISDEVYDQIFYETPHLRIATLPGMWERTITVGSAGASILLRKNIRRHWLAHRMADRPGNPAEKHCGHSCTQRLLLCHSHPGNAG
jgi:hypothetical protein